MTGQIPPIGSMLSPMRIPVLLCGWPWGLSGSSFTRAAFPAGAVPNAVPGMILHLALIPILVMALERAGLSLNKN